MSKTVLVTGAAGPDRRPDGTFIRQFPVWTPETWDAGFVDNRGYFRVYRPDYPRAWADGYAKRYHVVWWLEVGSPPLDVIHHRDGNKLNDVFGNLESTCSADHTRLHCRKPPIERFCQHCGGRFELSRSRNPVERGKFCSQACYHAKPRDSHHKEAISAGLRRSYQARSR